jgi:hypothetical protein
MFKSIVVRIAIWSLPAFLLGLLSYWGFLALTDRKVAQVKKETKEVKLGEATFVLKP